MAARARRPSGPRWDQLELAPVVLLTVGEPALGDRALARLSALARARTPGVEITKLDAAAYEAGALAQLTSPSLFGEDRMIVVPNMEKMSDAFSADALNYLEAPEPDVVLVLRHNGGNRGRKLLTAITAGGFQHSDIPQIKNDAEKAELVRGEARRARRRMTEGAAHDLVDALGRDIRELLAAVTQLLEDIDGTIDETAVHEYYRGRIEATPFAVADAVVAGQTGHAIALARHAMVTGTAPVPIVAAIATKLRSMALVLAMRGQARPGEVRLAPWQIDRAKKDLRGWSGEALAQSILVVAQADAEVKGASRDAAFALERAIVRIGEARRSSAP